MNRKTLINRKHYRAGRRSMDATVTLAKWDNVSDRWFADISLERNCCAVPLMAIIELRIYADDVNGASWKYEPCTHLCDAFGRKVSGPVLHNFMREWLPALMPGTVEAGVNGESYGTRISELIDNLIRAAIRANRGDVLRLVRGE